VLPEIPKGKEDPEGQSALEDAPRAGQGEEFSRILEIIREMTDKQNNFCPDNGNDDGVKGHIEEARSRETLFFGLEIKKPKPHSHTQSHHKTVGIDCDGAYFEEDGKHFDLLLKSRMKMRNMAPTLTLASATLKAGQCHFLR